MAETRTIIGSTAQVAFPKLGISAVPARVDTGARTSAVWATNIVEKGGVLNFKLFSDGREFYTGKTVRTRQFGQKVVTSSNGIRDERYVVHLLIEVRGRRLIASFTLADRSTQAYPILIGRNVLRGKFIVDVAGAPKHPKPTSTGAKDQEGNN